MRSCCITTLPASEENYWERVSPFLCHFILHPLDGRLEEEFHQILVGTLSADLPQGRDIGRTVFQTDDE